MIRYIRVGWSLRIKNNSSEKEKQSMIKRIGNNHLSSKKTVLIKRLLVLFCCLSSFFHKNASQLHAQQDPQYSQYMFNQLAINPGYAGSKEAISAAMFFRSQWTGMPGSPKTQTITVHGPTKKKKVALGFTVIADEVGPKKSVGALGTYAYRIKLGKGKLSMGLRVGAYRYVFDWNKIEYKDKTDVYNQIGTSAKNVLTADAGAYYYTNTMYAGFSATHLNYGRLTTVDNQNGDNAQLKPHLFFTGGKAWAISDKLVFSPSCMVKVVVNTPVTADINFSFLIQKRLWVGLSARSFYGLSAYMQFYATNKFKIGYAYDFGINKVGRAGGGSHEIMLSYDLKIAKPPFISPRYF